MVASAEDYLDVVMLLSDSKSTHQVTEEGETALLIACDNEHLDTILHLVGISDVRAVQSDGLTSLKLAFKRDRKDIVEAIAAHTTLTEMDLTDCYLYSESEEIYSWVRSRIN